MSQTYPGKSSDFVLMQKKNREMSRLLWAKKKNNPEN